MGTGTDLDTGAVGWGNFGDHRYRFSHCCVQGGARPWLSTIVEGESLFNDGVALVLFSLILKVNATGSPHNGWAPRTLCGDCRRYLGASLGLSAGLFVRSDDPLSSILLTLAVALEPSNWALFGVSGCGCRWVNCRKYWAWQCIGFNSTDLAQLLGICRFWR